MLSTNMPPPLGMKPRGRAMIVFGVIFVLLSVALILLAPGVVSSTISANQGMHRGLLGGMVVEWAKGIAWGMVFAGICFYVTGMIMLISGVVRERRRRKIIARNNPFP